MSSGWRHTIVRIVRTRSKTQTRRPVRPDSVEDFFAEQHPPIRREPSVSGRRSRGRRAIVGSIIAAVVLVAGIVAALVLTMPSIGEVEPTGVTKDHAPQLDFVVAHPFRLTASKVSVRIDGHAVAPSAISVSSGGSVSVDTPRLADGRHDVSATVDGVGVLRLAMHHRWSITVDTVAPEVRTTSPAPATADDAGTYDEVEGERCRVNVTLCTGIDEERVRKANLGYLAPEDFDLAAYEADPDTMVVPNAGETLFRLR